MGETEYEFPDFVIREGDYSIPPDSPAVDAGVSEGAPETDIAGSRRPCGAGVDIGAYEYCGGEFFRRGDVNADGNFDVADPVGLIDYLFGGGPEPSCPDAADGNDDGKLEISDAVTMLVILFGRGGTLPPPYRSCGSDPTKDSLGGCRYPPYAGAK